MEARLKLVLLLHYHQQKSSGHLGLTHHRLREMGCCEFRSERISDMGCALGKIVTRERELTGREKKKKAMNGDIRGLNIHTDILLLVLAQGLGLQSGHSSKKEEKNSHGNPLGLRRPESQIIQIELPCCGRFFMIKNIRQLQ